MFTLIVLFPFIKEADIPLLIKITIYLFIFGIFLYLIFLSYKTENNQKKMVWVIGIFLITAFILFLLYYYFLNM